MCACKNTQRTTALAGAWVLKCLSKVAVCFSSSPGPCRSERAERARYRSSTRLCVCVSVSNRALGIGIGSALQSWIAQLAELHTVSHSASTLAARGNMPAHARFTDHLGQSINGGLESSERIGLKVCSRSPSTPSPPRSPQRIVLEVRSARFFVRVETVSTSTSALVRSAPRMIDYSTFYNVIRSPPSSRTRRSPRRSPGLESEVC